MSPFISLWWGPPPSPFEYVEVVYGWSLTSCNLGYIGPRKKQQQKQQKELSKLRVILSFNWHPRIHITSEALSKQNKNYGNKKS